MKNLIGKVRPYVKAVVATVGAGVTYLIATGVADPNVPLWQAVFDTLGSLKDFTGTQWVGLASALAGTGYFTWLLPNRVTV